MKNMEVIYYFLAVFSLLFAATDAAECEAGWVAYKDNLCIKVFDDLLTYDEAKTFCSAAGSDIAKTSLVIVKEEELQELLAEFTQSIHDYLWLGGKYEQETEQFRWEDGDSLTYTNWQEGYPRNISDPDVCIELRPIGAKAATKVEGKWADASCQKRNRVMCQKTFSWTLEDAINEILAIRKELTKAQEDVNRTEHGLITMTQEFREMAARVVPVGSTYIEYYDQPSPPSLWPDLIWEDITDTYAGLFFRASGGDSETWGEIQSECAPRISEIDFDSSATTGFPDPQELPLSGWSDFVQSGETVYPTPNGSQRVFEGLKFYIESCEVRPRNQAVRVWKRTA